MSDWLDQARDNATPAQQSGELIKWDEPGRAVAGEVVGRRAVTTDLGEMNVVDVLGATAPKAADLDGSDRAELAVPLTTDLRRAINARKLRGGDRLFIEYTNDDDIGKGRTMKRFHVAVIRDGDLVEPELSDTAGPADTDVPF